MIASFFGGFYSANLYEKLNGKKWVMNIFITAFMFMLPCFNTWCFTNTIALLYGSTAALPFGTVLIILALWVAITLSLSVVGGLAGRAVAQKEL